MRPFKDPAEFFAAGESQVLLLRPAGVAIFYSTQAFLSSGGFDNVDGEWVERRSGAHYDVEQGWFIGGSAGGVERLDGFDTFWFNWSMNNPTTELLQ